MKVAVITEISTSLKNADIVNALQGFDIDVYNLGMTNPRQVPELTYIQTGIMSAMLLNLKAVDCVIGGCGTGQGYFNSVMQYPNVFCGLILDPLDAWLFSQINAGNCISLALNKGYGWAGEINLKYIFDKFFGGKSGLGYPPSRSESQSESRRLLKEISQSAHRPFAEILKAVPQQILMPVKVHEPFIEAVKQLSPDGELKEAVLEALKN